MPGCVAEAHGPGFNYCCCLNTLYYAVLVVMGLVSTPRFGSPLRVRRARPWKFPWLSRKNKHLQFNYRSPRSIVYQKRLLWSSKEAFGHYSYLGWWTWLLVSQCFFFLSSFLIYYRSIYIFYFTLLCTYMFLFYFEWENISYQCVDTYIFSIHPQNS